MCSNENFSEDNEGTFLPIEQQIVDLKKEIFSLNETIDKTRQLLKDEIKKEFIIGELIDCGLWEYDIATQRVTQTRKFKGRYKQDNLIVENFRETFLNWGLVYSEDLPIFEAFCDDLDAGRPYIERDFRLFTDEDVFTWLRFKGIGITDSNHKPIRVIGVTLNINEEKLNCEASQRKAEQDSLTTLYNKQALKNYITNYLSIRPNNNGNIFFLIDIDNFHKINNTWGHLYGDYVIEAFGNMLANLFPHETLGRLDSDLFILFLRGPFSKKEASEKRLTVCKKILTETANLCFKNSHSITVSIGTSTYPEDGKTFDTLYQNADIALYKAKTHGKNRYEFYNRVTDYKLMASKPVKTLATSNIALSHSNTKLLDKIDSHIFEFALKFINRSDEIPLIIHRILSETGKYYGLSYISIIEKNASYEHNYNEWSNDLLTHKADLSSQITPSLWKKYDKRFLMTSMFVCEDLSTLDSEERHLYNAQNVKSFLQCAFFESGEFAGYILFEKDNTESGWSDSECNTLALLTKIISIYLFRFNTKIELEKETFYTKGMLDNQLLSYYCIEKNSYKLSYINEHAHKLFHGIKLGETCYKAIFNRQSPCELCPLKNLSAEDDRTSIETYDDKRRAWFSVTASRLSSPTAQYLICWADVTAFIERVKATDSLTGLLTLDKFDIEATKLLYGPDKSHYAAVYMDFNRFKNINQTLGYSTGDDLLKLFSSHFLSVLEVDELGCRINADQFIFLMHAPSDKELIERLQLIYFSISNSFEKYFPELKINMSSGVYFIRKDDYQINIAMDRANMARKTLKKYQSYIKHEIAIYDEKLHAEVMRKHMIESQMYSALENHEFKVFIQPKLNLNTEHIGGAEMLVRWIPNNGNMFFPNEFIPLFENNGFINKLDFYMYEEIFKKINDWLAEGKNIPTISINVSRVSLKDPSFVHRFIELTKKYAIPPHLVELELTENIFFENLDKLLYILNELRKYGFSISIDDFGTGYSSLNLVQVLPVDILKLDKGFFLKNELSDKAKTIVLNIINLAKGLGLKIIAEGVENEEQVDFLKETKCDMIQGYYFYKPIPVYEFEQLI